MIARRVVTALRVHIRRGDGDFGGTRPRFAKYDPPHIEDSSEDEAARKPR